MNLKTIFGDERAAVLAKALNDESLDRIDLEILKLAATNQDGTIDAMDAYEEIDESFFSSFGDVHPVDEEEAAEEQFLPRMKRLAEAGYLIESEEKNTPGIYKDFTLNLNTSK